MVNIESRTITGGGGDTIDGTGHVLILPPNNSTTTAGTWALTVDSSAYTNCYWSNTTTAQNDECNWSVWLAAGTYTIVMIGESNTDHGMTSIKLGASEVADFNWYDAGQTRNIVKTDAGNVVASSAVYDLSVTVDDKDASSSDYECKIYSIAFYRTA